MRAVIQDRFGGPEVLRIAEVDRPEPLPTEVLVRVAAAGVNPVDWKTRSGRGMAPVLGDPPFTVGWDVAGVVEGVGYGVTRFSVGDRVFGMPWFPRQAAAYAEYVTAPSRHFAGVPGGVDLAHAAGLPLAGLTAWQTLVDTAAVGAGRRVLVHAAAGGVGHLAVQIAKARGAHVLGTASEARQDFLQALGVDEPIDYTATAFEDAAGEVDLVVDLLGTRDYGLRSLRCLKAGGTLFVVPSGVDEEVRRAGEDAGRRVTGILVEPDGHALEALAELMADRRLRVELDEVVPLEEVAYAHERMESGRTRGKLVLAVAPDLLDG